MYIYTYIELYIRLHSYIHAFIAYMCTYTYILTYTHGYIYAVYFYRHGCLLPYKFRGFNKYNKFSSQNFLILEINSLSPPEYGWLSKHVYWNILQSTYSFSALCEIVCEIVTTKYMCNNLYRLAQVMLSVALLWYEMYCRISVHKELPDWTYDFERQALHILVRVL